MEFLLFLQQICNPIFDFIFENATLLINETLVVAIISYVYWCHNKKTAQIMAFSLFLSGLVVQVMKIWFRVPRPWIIDERIKPKQKIIDTATGYSFPSGHTQTATAISYSTIQFHKKKSVQVILLVFPLIVMFSRLYLGVHTLCDVVVSYLVTLLITTAQMNYLKIYSTKRVTNIAVLILIISILSLMYVNYLVLASISPFELVEDTAKIIGCAIGFSLGIFLETNFLDFSIVKENKKRIVVLAIGAISTLALKIILNIVFPESTNVVVLIYGIITFWISYLYPYILCSLNFIIGNKKMNS